MSQDDLSVLLGTDIEEIVNEAKEKKNEIQKLDNGNVEQRIFDETANILDRSNGAISAVLREVEAAPDDFKILEGAAKLLDAHRGLIDSLSRLHLSNEKFKQQVYLTKMKIDAADKMNTDNNITRMTLTRKEFMENLRSAGEKGSIMGDEVIEADEVNEEI